MSDSNWNQTAVLAPESNVARASASITVEPGFVFEQIVAGSGFHTANGVAFGPDGLLFVASVAGESIFALDVATGAIQTIVGPPAGEADDLVFSPDGDMIWTAFMEGIVRMKGVDGEIKQLASGLPGANSIAFTRDGKRLFVGQVFMGDGMWEIDLAGKAAPRLVAADTGGINACQFGPDGMIYGPSWDRGQVVRIDPETGETAILADDFKKPGAVRFDVEDNLFVLDDMTGEIFALEEANGKWNKRLIVQLPSATDNMVIGPNGFFYVSGMPDNAIYEVDAATGDSRIVVAGKLGFPRAIAVSTGVDGDLLHIADTGAYRVVDPRTKEVRDIARAVATTLKFPASVSVHGTSVLLTAELFGAIEIFNLDGKMVREVSGLSMPAAAIECEDGTIVVTEPLAGRVLLLSGDQKDVLAEGLQLPSGLADAGDESIYVAESASGRLLRIGLKDRNVTVVAENLGTVRAIATTPDGSVAVLDLNGGRVLLLAPATGVVTLVAQGFAVGRLQKPYARSGGIAVGSDGTMYIAADAENALYRISRKV